MLVAETSPQCVSLCFWHVWLIDCCQKLYIFLFSISPQSFSLSLPPTHISVLAFYSLFSFPFLFRRAFSVTHTHTHTSDSLSVSKRRNRPCKEIAVPHPWVLAASAVTSLPVIGNFVFESDNATCKPKPMFIHTTWGWWAKFIHCIQLPRALQAIFCTQL